MYLLDTNVLIALFWPVHNHHKAVLKWFSVARESGWMTCAHTQAAFVRVISQPAFYSPPVTVADASGLLVRNITATDHRFLPLKVNVTDVLNQRSGGVVGHRQITDAWLIKLAN